MVTTTFIILNSTPLHSKATSGLKICLRPCCVHIRCWWTDLHRRQLIWLQWVGCLAHSNAQMTMWGHQIMMPEIQRAKSINSGNPQINFLHHQGIVNHLCSLHFQALPSSTTLPHLTWHQARNEALVQLNDIWAMGHLGQDTISSKKVMVDLKCSPLSNSPDRGHHLQGHLKSLQHRLESFHLFRRQLPPLLHMDNFPAHLEDAPLASQRNDFSQLRNWAGQMMQGLRICPHYQRVLMTSSMQMMRVMISWTWAGPKAKPQSAWSQWSSPWRNLPKGWGCPTRVHSTSGRKYG